MKNHASTLAGFAMLILIWHLAVRLLDVPSYLVPSPVAVAAVFMDKPRLLTVHGLETLKAILLGYLLAVAVGIGLAIVFVSSRVISRIVYPLIVTMQTLPKVAVAPLFVIWFGFGLQSRVLITFLICFFPILVNTMTGLMATTIELVRLVQSMGASPRQIFAKIRLPGALPSIFSGLKIAVMSAVIGSIVAEFVGANTGLGYLLLIARGTLETELMFAILVVLSAIGITLYFLVATVERLLTPWHVSQRIDHLSEQDRT